MSNSAIETKKEMRLAPGVDSVDVTTDTACHDEDISRSRLARGVDASGGSSASMKSEKTSALSSQLAARKNRDLQLAPSGVHPSMDATKETRSPSTDEEHEQQTVVPSALSPSRGGHTPSMKYERRTEKLRLAEATASPSASVGDRNDDNGTLKMATRLRLADGAAGVNGANDADSSVFPGAEHVPGINIVGSGSIPPAVIENDCGSADIIDAPCHPSLEAEVVDVEAEEQLRNRVTELEHRLRRQSETQTDKTNFGLCYESVEIVGRKDETELLLSRLDRLRAETTTNAKELVLISGYSGVGKSELTNILADRVQESGMFARGKYDLNQRDTPCSVITQALDHLFDTMNSDKATEIGQSIVSELGSEAQLLMSLLPNLEAVLPRMEGQNADIMIPSVGYESGHEKWKYIFRTSMKILSYHFSPLILVLDDLQWADALSLKILEYLLTDIQNTNGFMIVGCYRSNEVDENHELSKHIQSLRQKSESFNFNCTEMEVTNLRKEAANQVVMALLTMNDPEETRELADICFKRTLGNPFFLIEFMTMLKRDDLIRFRMDSLKWDWDVQTIQEATVSADNVVDLLERRMEQLSSELQLVLQYAACLGSSFCTDMMDIVWTEHSHSTSTRIHTGTQHLPDIYARLVSENFIESRGTKTYAWVHDKVQEAALSLGDASSESFQFEIGNILSTHMAEDKLEESIFNVVDLLQKGNTENRADFAALNLRAARKAKNLSAFESAATYVWQGIRMLPEDCWRSDRELVLSLYCLGVEVELAAGHFPEMDELSRAVLSRKDCSIAEKLPVLYAESYRRCNQMEIHGAIAYALRVLKDLGCNLVPISAFLPIYAIRSLHRAVRKGRNKTRDFYKTLPVLSDKKERTVMGMLNILGTAAYFNSQEYLLLYVLSTARAVERILKYGVNEESGIVFGNMAAIVGAMNGDVENSIFFAEIGLMLQDRTSSKYHAAECLFTACGFSLASVRPLESLLPSFWKGYQLGMQSGNVIYAMHNLLYYQVVVPFQLGSPLASIESELDKTIGIMEDLGETSGALLARAIGQTILNLRQNFRDNLVLKGDLFNSEGWVPPTEIHGYTLYLLELQLSVIFADYERAMITALLLGENYQKSLPGSFTCQEETLFRGLAFYKAAGRNGKTKKGKRLLKRLNDWEKNGNPNVHHYTCLLNAEQASLDRKHTVADAFYRESIDLAANKHNWKHAALSCECYAQFLRDVTCKEDASTLQFKEALKYYGKWGANFKVQRLEAMITDGTNNSSST